MGYKPLQISAGAETGYKNSMMPRAGVNLEDLSQTMDFAYALKLINYIPQKYGLEKRRGINEIFARVGANAITLLEEFTAGVWIVGYSTKIEAYDTTTDTWTTIKDDFSANTGFDGERYGDYFFVCNGVEKIHRIDNALAIAEVAAAPICSGLKVIGPRLYAFNLSSDETAIQYSEVDDASNPPFDGWTQTSAADTGGTVNYRNAGAVRSVCQLGQTTVAFSDKGFFAFYINVVDSAGTMKKVEIIQNYTEDFGGARGAIETPEGIYYVNEAGLWQIIAVGNTDQPMSKQQGLVSTLLGSKYFQGVDQTSVDLIQDTNQKLILVTMAKDSSSNNVIVGYKPELKSFFMFSGWNINRFAKSGETIYGASSVKTSVYELFTGYDDDGLNIGTVVRQEVPLGTLFHAHSLSEMFAGGQLSSATELKIRFDVYDKQGVFKPNKVSLDWTVDSANGTYDEWASARWGESGWGGNFDTGGLVQCFDGGSPKISNFQRLIYEIVGGDKLPHIIYWVSFKTTKKMPIRRRHITLTS